MIPVIDRIDYLGWQLDLKIEIAPQLMAGANHYQQRTGHWPDKILINLSHIDAPGLADLGVEIVGQVYVLKSVAYIGTAYSGGNVLS